MASSSSSSSSGKEQQESSDITQEKQHSSSSSSSSRELVPAGGGVTPVTTSEAPLKKSRGDDYHVNHRLIVATLEDTSGDLKFKECDLYSAFHSLKPEVTDLDHPFTGKPHTSIEIVGSCNGLICVVVDGEEIFLWNPSTGTSKAIPNFGFKSLIDRPPYSHIMSYGFGYDATKDDHKVVGISCGLYSSGVSKHQTVAKIYSVRTDLWNWINLSQDRIADNLCLFVNGKFHWSAARPPNEQGESDAGQEILTVDLATEMRGVIEQPDYGGTIYYWTLGKLGGCLSLCVYSQTSRAQDVWVMMEYGVKNSWTKLFTFPHYLSGNLGAGAFVKPIFGAKDGRVACLYQAQYMNKKQILAICIPKINDMIGELEIRNLEDLLDGAEVYVKSSVSPDFPHGVQRTGPSN